MRHFFFHFVHSIAIEIAVQKCPALRAFRPIFDGGFYVKTKKNSTGFPRVKR